MGHNPKPQMKMIFVGLAWEWDWRYAKANNLRMLWLGPIRIGVFIQ